MWQGLLSNYKHRDLHKDPSTGSGSFKAKGSICMTVGGGLFCWDVFDGHIQAANSMCEITGHEGDEGEGHGHRESMCSSVAPFTVPERSLTGDIFLHPTLFPCYNNTVVIRVLSKKKHWKELATAKREAFSCISCYRRANSCDWLHVSIDQVEQNIPLFLFRSPCFPSRATHTCSRQNYSTWTWNSWRFLSDMK